MKKVITGIFAVIGMLSVVIGLISVGYFAGRLNNVSSMKNTIVKDGDVVELVLSLASAEME